ncbi:MAG: Hsp70 family protein, partial [Planctomycetaceae bacterium]|nr:Hsp70 family protein [Planctomycetaceae bacterium]
EDMILMDVTPLSLGIETEGGIMTVLVERNTTIPTTKKETFSTAADNQTAVTVRVFQGERQMAQDNRLLGQFNLDGIPPAPRGVPQIEVSFDIDVNGILNVSAKDLASGKDASVRIEQSSGLSETEIKQMRKDAESHAAEDEKKRKLAEAVNKGNTLVYETEKMLKENEGKLDDSSKSAIEGSIAKIKSAIESENPEAINTACDELQQAAMAWGQQLHEAAAQSAPDGEAAGETAGATADSGGDDDVIDAEFEKKE